MITASRDYVNKIFQEFNIDKIDIKDIFSIEYNKCILSIIVKRHLGKKESLVLYVPKGDFSKVCHISNKQERNKIFLELVEEGNTLEEIGKVFGFSKCAMEKIIREAKENKC